MDAPDVMWAIHNIIAHPVSEVCHWIGMDRFGGWLHDATVPDHKPGEGRG